MTNLRAILFLLMAVSACTIRAEQLVVLRTGAEIIGEVAFEGDDVVVTVGGSPLRVPQEKVARIAANIEVEGPAADNRAQRLLLEWLERQALHGDGSLSDPGGLAEASRLAPEDARIAFWYVTSLVGAGEGRKAREVFEKHRDTIVNNYPATATELQSRIAERCKIEQRPTAFVKRYDQLGSQLRGGAQLPADKTLMAAAFRLVDQKGESIPAQSLSTSMNECRIEPFADGWFLLSYMMRGYSGDEPVTLRLTDPAYAPQEFKVHGGADQIREMMEIRVQKRDNNQLVKTRFRVTNTDGAPLEGARLTLRLLQSNGIGGSQIELTTASNGIVDKELFPADYLVTSVLNNYLPESHPFVVEAATKGAAAANPKTLEIRLSKSLRGVVRFAWRTLSSESDKSENADETEQTAEFEFANGQLIRTEIAGTWLHIRQLKQNLSFIAVDHRMMHRPSMGGETWSRVARERFEDIDLGEIASLKKSSDKPKNISVAQAPNPGPLPFHFGSPLELIPGKVYFGEMLTMLPYGGPQTVKMIRYKFVFEPTEEGSREPAEAKIDDAEKSDTNPAGAPE